ncbi:hypothetical protein [Blattabacterium cuenoti]|uniref:hypothetical protein n=1 Tax=Blattabacterium cuenoti TaxID=1653831 RepID=UPI00163BF20A|nr:hypothetical protein [Blattabacterium cuenoti]
MKSKLLFVFFLLFFSCNDEDFLKNQEHSQNMDDNSIFPYHEKNNNSDKLRFFISDHIIKAPLDGYFFIWGTMKLSHIQNEKKKYPTISYGIDVFINNFLKYKTYFKDCLNEEDKKISKLDLKGNFHLKIPVKKNDQLYLQYSVKRKDPISLYFFDEKQKVLRNELDHIKIFFHPSSHN